MIEFEDYRNYLQSELVKRIKLNPRYSQRAFAKLLGLSPGALSEILKGKRKLSYKNAKKIANALALNKGETQHFIRMVDENIEVTDSDLGVDSQQLSQDVFNVVSNWYCFAILNLADCKDFRWNYAWISKRLGISLVQAKDAIENMVRVGLVQETPKGLKASESFVLSPDGIPSKAVRDFHHSILEKAREALENQPIDKREISGISFAIDPKNLDSLKKDIDTFQNEIVEKYGKGKRSEVYHLESALFSLTNLRDEK